MSRQDCRSTRGQLQCPKSPRCPTLPPTPKLGVGLGHGHQGWGRTVRLEPATEGQHEECRASRCALYSLGTGSSAWQVHMEGKGSWWIFPGLELDEGLVPLNSFHLLQYKHSLPVFAGAWRRRLSADGCLLGPRVSEGGIRGDSELFMHLRGLLNLHNNILTKQER